MGTRGDRSWCAAVSPGQSFVVSGLLVSLGFRCCASVVCRTGGAVSKPAVWGCSLRKASPPRKWGRSWEQRWLQGPLVLENGNVIS